MARGNEFLGLDVKNTYLIGLTGNLGSGKSTVRKILEELGARGIDADALTHLVDGTRHTRLALHY